MLHVLHVTPSFARRDGGPSETLRGLIPALEARGISTHTLTTDKALGLDDRDFLQDNAVTVVKSRRPRSWNFAPGILRPLWRETRRADVIHIHSVNSFTSTIAMIVARLQRTPYLLEPHGALDRYHMREGSLKKFLYNSLVDRFGFAGLHGLFTSSTREKRDAALVLSAPTFDLPLGVDGDLLQMARTENELFSILFLGRVARKKRLDLLLHALATPEILDLDWVLRVAGPIGDDLDYNPSNLAADLGIAARVQFLGPVDRQARAQLLSSADAFVLASEDESFGVAAAEALAAGCAVLASLEVGIAEDADGADVLRSTRLSSASIAEQLVALLGNRSETRALGLRGRAYARTRFSWQNSARAAHQAYEAVVRK